MKHVPYRRGMIRFAPAFLLLFWIIPTFAAPGLPNSLSLMGPLLVSETGAGDELLIFDLGATDDPLTLLPPVRMLHPGGAVAGQPVRAWEFISGGCELLITAGDSGVFNRVYSLALDGERLTDLLPTLPADVGAWEPQMQPGGDFASGTVRLAYTRIERATPELAGTLSDDAAANFTHRVAWADGSGAEGFYSSSGDEHHARWSPDGTRLAYVAYQRAENGAREADLWITNADESDKFRLTDFPAGSTGAPRWSPDGDLLAFVYAPDGLRDQFWMIGGQAGAIPTQLSYSDLLALDFAWQPDGVGLIAAAADVQLLGRPLVRDMRLYRVPLVGSLDEQGAEYLPDPALPSLRNPRFSPDGRWLAVRSGYELILVEVATGAWVRLPGATANTAPIWSPVEFAGEGGC